MKNKTLILKLAKELQKDGIDALMLAPNSDLQFLVGSVPYLCERYQAFFITKEGKCFYICNRLSELEVKEFMEDDPVYAWNDSDGFVNTALKAFKDFDLIGKKIACNKAVRAFNLLKLKESISFCAIYDKDYLELARIIKTEEELENLRHSSKIVDQVFNDLLGIIQLGMSEKEINDHIISLSKKYGGENNHGGIVAIDAHAANPHYFGSSGIVTNPCTIEMDFGCTYKGMYSDITRTIFVGEVSSLQKEVYDLVLKANLKAEEVAKNGTYIPEVDKAARDLIEEAGYGLYFNHRLGHGIGYAGHEAPYIHGDYKMHLAPGMAFSIEPGIYLENQFGVRIEDVVIINLKGETEVLNKAPKELIQLNLK